MIKELYLDKSQNRVVIQNDDLKFDGKNVIIPSYWIDSLCEYIKDYKFDGESQGDIEDYKSFRRFLWDIQEYKNGGN